MRIEDFFISHNLSLKNKTLIVATSAGPDSMALVEKLRLLIPKYHFKLICAHLDHQLRKDSSQEMALLTPYCQKHQIKLVNRVWPKKMHPKTGLEAAARKFRYQFLVEVYQKNQADYLLTAHHGDDLLENILLKLIRSGNPEEMNSLKNITTFQGCKLVRPLFNYSKDELLNFVKAGKIPYVEDETNFQDETMRNRLRHHVIPLLKKENPNLLTNARRFQEEEKLLTNLAQRNFDLVKPEAFLDVAYRLPVEKLKLFTEKERQYFWQTFISKTWQVQVNQNLSGFTLKQYQNYYYIWPNLLDSKPESKIINLDRAFVFRKKQFLVSAKRLDLPLAGDFWSNETTFAIKSLPSGSRLLLKNSHHVKAKKMFAQAKIPLFLRAFCLSIFNHEGRAIFVENTYQDQAVLDTANHYYVYRLNY